MSKAFRVSAALALVVLSACYSIQTSIGYTPVVRGAEDALTTVKLQAVDARRSDRGGADPSEIGRARGLLGNAFPLLDDGSGAVAAAARAATADALRLARVGVLERSPRVLVATVRKFWVDGYVGYKATVEMQCDLRDEDGKVLWTSLITGEGGGVNCAGPQTFVRATFQRALAAYAEKAAMEFNSATFQKYLY